MPENKSLVIKTSDEIVLATLECTRMEDEHARAVQTEVIAAAAQAPNLPVVLMTGFPSFVTKPGMMVW